ncbi:MAG: hypothetical protein GY845_22400 [Planctomycetes bacterium]|nr:hypothetical protein [Planctomycetota bacterium]
MVNSLQIFEKVNACGIVTENYCKKRCHPNDNYSRFNNPPGKKSIEAAKAWINKHCWKRKTTNWIRSSYRLKHDVEHETGIYIRNGEFIKVAILKEMKRSWTCYRLSQELKDKLPQRTVYAYLSDKKDSVNKRDISAKRASIILKALGLKIKR